MKKAFFLIISGHLLLLSLLNFTAWPEMISYPYLFTHGFTLYKDFIMPYPPLLIWLLSVVFHFAGFNPFALKLLTWVLIILGDFILFIILKKVITEKIWLIIFMGIFVFLQSILDGNMLWFDFATVIPLLCAFYYLLKWQEQNKSVYIFLTALFISLAIMIKQVALVYLLPFFFIVYMSEKQRVYRKLFYIFLGLLIPVIPLTAYIFLNDASKEFLEWTIIFPLVEWPKFPGYVNYRIPFKEFAMSLVLFFPVVLAPLNIKKIYLNKNLFSALIFLFAAIIAIYPRFSFFHLQPVLAFWIVLVAQLYFLFSGMWRKIHLFLIVLVAGLGLLVSYQSFGGNIRFYEDSEQQTASMISVLSKPTERTLLLGLNSSLYAYSDTLPPLNWGDNFGWYLEIPGVQEWVITGMKKTPPKLIFWKNPKGGNWYDLGTYQPRKIADYVQTNYHKVGKIDGVDIWQKE